MSLLEYIAKKFFCKGFSKLVLFLNKEKRIIMTKKNVAKIAVASALAVSLAVTNIVPILASSELYVPVDGKTDATGKEDYSTWQTKWETLKDDWTQISFTPGSDETELNCAWYTKVVYNEETDKDGNTERRICGICLWC